MYTVISNYGSIEKKLGVVEWKIGLNTVLNSGNNGFNIIFILKSHCFDNIWESPKFWLYNGEYSFVLRVIIGKEIKLSIEVITFQNILRNSLSTTSLGIKNKNGVAFKSVTSNSSNSSVSLLQLYISVSEFLKHREEIAPSGIITFFLSSGEYQNPNEKTHQTYRNDKDQEKENIFKEDIHFLAENLRTLFIKEENCDMKFKVGDREFNTHKLIVTARSPVFASMFEHKMVESNTGIVTIDDCDPDGFRNFLLYLYTAKVDDLSLANVLAMYPIAHKYDVPHLMRHCLNVMLNDISVDFFCDVISLALKYDERLLIEAAEKYFVNNLVQILSSGKWQAFIQEHPIVANELFLKYAKSNA